MTQLKNALQLAAMGLPVFPVKAGQKVPACAHGCQDATTDPEKIEQMFNDPTLNIGLATGDLTGDHSLKVGTYNRVIVFDDDSAKHNTESFIDKAAREHGIKIQPTVCYRTGGGGTSYIYLDPEGLIQSGGASRDLAFDVRGNGHYSVIPDSTLNSTQSGVGKYEWIKSPFDMPVAVLGPAERALYDLWVQLKGGANKRPQKSSNPSQFKSFKVEGEIKSGCRNDSLFRAVAGLVGAGFPESSIYVIADLINDSLCDPPISDRELSRTVTAAINRYDGGDHRWLEENNPYYILTVSACYLSRKNYPPSVIYGGAQAVNDELSNPLDDDQFNRSFNRCMKQLHLSSYCV